MAFLLPKVFNVIELRWKKVEGIKELREFFPDNAVEYFISYYDYYQPEAYVPVSDTYIAKTSSINEEIDMLRHSATRSLFERDDVIVVASISCIYGLGIPSEYLKASVKFQVGQSIDLRSCLRSLVSNQYTRNDIEISRGRFRVRGDVLAVSYTHLTLPTKA